MIERPSFSLRLRFLVLAGLAWALTEVVFGSLLSGSCPRGMAGSILTGTALFFIAAAREAGGFPALLMPLALAVAGKVAGAALLGRPVLHGSVLNPSYAYATEVLALAVVAGMAGRRLAKPGYAIAAGAGSALAAAALFVPVGLATGAAACIHPASGLPLSIVHAPVAMAIAAATVPLGRAVGIRAMSGLARTPAGYGVRRFGLDLASAATAAAVLAAHAAF